MNDGTIMKIGMLTLSAGCLAALATGCVERRVVYVPAYQAQPVYQAAPAYTYQPQTAYQAPPADASAAAVAPQANTQPGPPPNTVIMQTPPAAQVEVVPAPPGPDYVWMPGYWAISGGGGWVWVGGHYALPPRPRAVWVGGYWGRHGRGYVWIGGHWR